MGRFITTEQLYLYSDAVSVRFKRQPAKQDRRHLVVVFSGFCPIGRYNFDGSVADGCRMDILWINDQFDDNNSYYLCRSMNFEIEDAVSSLIESELKRLDISRDNCTLLGYSKGGSAALYYGIKHGMKNIIASAPQMHIGSFARDNFNSSFLHMTIAGEDHDATRLDSILPASLANESDFNKNVYLISSFRDQFHSSEVVPYLPDFELYDNFNLIMTDSDLVDEHKVVGAYNTPIVLSILYALGEGVAPSFDNIVNGGGRLKPEKELTRSYHAKRALAAESVVKLDKVSVLAGRLYPEGVALIRGISQNSYGLKNVYLVLVSEDGEHSFELGSAFDKALSSRFFDRYFCDYSFAGYKSLESKGVSLEDVPHGRYKVFLKSVIGDVQRLVSLSTDAGRKLCDMSKHGYLYWDSDAAGASLVKRPIIGPTSVDAVFELSLFRADGLQLFIEGVFALPHVNSGGYDRKRYSLVLVSEGHIEVLSLAQGNRPKLDLLFDGFGNHSKALFTTSKYAGISLAGMPDGDYETYVNFACNESLVSQSLDRRIVLRGGIAFIVD